MLEEEKNLSRQREDSFMISSEADLQIAWDTGSGSFTVGLPCIVVWLLNFKSVRSKFWRSFLGAIQLFLCALVKFSYSGQSSNIVQSARQIQFVTLMKVPTIKKEYKAKIHIYIHTRIRSWAPYVNTRALTNCATDAGTREEVGKGVFIKQLPTSGQSSSEEKKKERRMSHKCSSS